MTSQHHTKQLIHTARDRDQEWGNGQPIVPGPVPGPCPSVVCTVKGIIYKTIVPSPISVPSPVQYEWAKRRGHYDVLFVYQGRSVFHEGHHLIYISFFWLGTISNTMNKTRVPNFAASNFQTYSYFLLIILQNLEKKTQG